jgi:hypothetical protein
MSLIKKGFLAIVAGTIVQVTSEETGGKYSVCEIKVPPQSGPPPH